MLTKLIDLGYVGTGTTPSMKNPDYYNSNDILFIKPSDIYDNAVSEIVQSEFFISSNARQKARIFPKNTILCVCIGSIGKIGITTKESSCNQQINYIIPNEKHNAKFIAYSLFSRKDELIRIGSDGPVVPIINKSRFENIEIITFDYEKETEVANELDNINNIIDLKKKELLSLDELIKSRFIEMFGDPDANPFDWEIVTINDVCSSIVRGPFGSALKKEFFVPKSETTIKVYEQQHAIKKNDKLGTYYVTKEKYQSLKRFTCHEGDILMSCSGTMGELYQLPIGCEKGIINQALCKFTLNQKMLPIVFLESMKHVVDQIDKKGSGIQNIAAVSYVKSMKMCLPPIQIQKKFVTFYEQVDKSKFVYYSRYFL